MENQNIQTTESKELGFMPDGWTENTDIFAGTGWAGSDGVVTDGLFKTDEFEALASDGTSTETPTTEQTDEGTDSTKTESETLPTSQDSTEKSTKHRFKAKIDHKNVDVEVDDSELPDMYQKSKVAERYRSKLDAMTPTYENAELTATLLGYKTVDEMLEAAKKSYTDAEIDKLKAEKVHPEVAKDIVGRKVKEVEETVAKNRRASAKAENTSASEDAKSAAETDSGSTESEPRNFRGEVQDLLKNYPELKKENKLPQSVIDDAIRSGRTLTAAYSDYKSQQQKAEETRINKEKETLKQNAESAKRAPVRGVSKGGSDSAPDDPFLSGFNSRNNRYR